MEWPKDNLFYQYVVVTSEPADISVLAKATGNQLSAAWETKKKVIKNFTPKVLKEAIDAD